MTECFVRKLSKMFVLVVAVALSAIAIVPCLADDSSMPLHQLPASYRMLEYIEANGTQWFDTGVQVGQHVGCKIGLAPMDVDAYQYGGNPDNFQVYVGASIRLQGSTDPHGAMCDPIAYFCDGSGDSIQSWDIGIGNTLHVNDMGTPTVGQKYNIESYIDANAGNEGDTSYIQVDGTKKSRSDLYYSDDASVSIPTDWAAETQSFYFNARNEQNARASQIAYARYYYCELYTNCNGSAESGTLAAKYIPCLNEDGVPGMFDQVTGGFFPSQSGTDFLYQSPIDADFIWGNDINNKERMWWKTTSGSVSSSWTNKTSKTGIEWINDGSKRALFPSTIGSDIKTSLQVNDEIHAKSIAYMLQGVISNKTFSILTADEVVFGKGSYHFTGDGTNNFGNVTKGSTFLFGESQGGSICSVCP